MNKQGLIDKVTAVLKDNNVRKPVTAQKTVLHITDDEGNNSDFVIKKSNKGLLFTAKDVTAIIDALIAVVEDSMKRGEEISIHGFGTLGVKYRAARKTKHPESGELVEIGERYVPKFNFGNSLRMAAKVYEMSLTENLGD